MVIVAVKTAVVQSQIVFPTAEEMEMVGVAVLFTVIVIALLLAIAGIGQLKLLDISQVTTSASFNVDVMYVALFVPTGEPFTNHW